MKTQEFQEITFDAKQNILFVRVNEKTAEIDDEDFKNAQYEIIDNIIATKVNAIIINIKKLRFSISPQLQEWDAQEIAPKFFGNGVKKVAYIMPISLIEKLSIEQILEEVEERKTPDREFFMVDFFENEENAINWCINL